jgi:hypothetical protein
LSAGTVARQATAKERIPKMKARTEICRKTVGDVVTPVGLTFSE